MSDKEDQEALQKILAYAKKLKWRDYRGAIASWRSEYKALMARKPRAPSALTDHDETQKKNDCLVLRGATT